MHRHAADSPLLLTRSLGVPDAGFRLSYAVTNEEQAWALYRAANQPKRLLLASRFGHAEDGFTPTFAERIASAVLELTA